jgi:hypothetical protein
MSSDAKIRAPKTTRQEQRYRRRWRNPDDRLRFYLMLVVFGALQQGAFQAPRSAPHHGGPVSTQRGRLPPSTGSREGEQRRSVALSLALAHASGSAQRGPPWALLFSGPRFCKGGHHGPNVADTITVSAEYKRTPTLPAPSLRFARSGFRFQRNTLPSLAPQPGSTFRSRPSLQVGRSARPHQIQTPAPAAFPSPPAGFARRRSKVSRLWRAW